MSRSRVDSELPLDQRCEVTQYRHIAEGDFPDKNASTGTSDSEEPATEFFDELKPVMYTMKVFGLFPLQKRNSEKSTFKRCKISLLYSVIFYMTINIWAYYVSRERIKFIRSSETRFDDLIFSVVHFLYVLPHFYLIPCHWKEVSKVGSYFVHWSDFQKQFLSVTGKHLYLGQRRRAIWSSVLSPVLALAFIGSERFLMSAQEKYWEHLFSGYIFTIILLHVSWWWLVCSSLRTAINTLSANFFKDPSIFQYESSAMVVARYRVLWMSLSKLCRETGCFMCYTYGHLLILSFSAMTLQLYGSLSDVNDGLYLRHLGLALAVGVVGGVSYVCCNSAHHASSEVGTEFSEKLSLLCSSDKQVRRELKIFTQVMTVHSCAINLGGYVTVDRGFLMKFASTMVTYLVVLLQFRLGILSVNSSNSSISTVTSEALGI